MFIVAEIFVGQSLNELVDDLFGLQSGREQVEHVDHTNAHSTHAGASATLLRIRRDPVHELYSVAHSASLNLYLYSSIK